MRAFVFIYILAMLGAIVSLTIQYSLWIACAITYIFTMLVVAVNAYVGGSRPSWKSNSKVLDNKPEVIIAEREGQATLEDLKAA